MVSFISLLSRLCIKWCTMHSWNKYANHIFTYMPYIAYLSGHIWDMYVDIYSDMYIYKSLVANIQTGSLYTYFTNYFVMLLAYIDEHIWLPIPNIYVMMSSFYMAIQTSHWCIYVPKHKILQVFHTLLSYICQKQICPQYCTYTRYLIDIYGWCAYVQHMKSLG